MNIFSLCYDLWYILINRTKMLWPGLSSHMPLNILCSFSYFRKGSIRYCCVQDTKTQTFLCKYPVLFIILTKISILPLAFFAFLASWIKYKMNIYSKCLKRFWERYFRFLSWFISCHWNECRLQTIWVVYLFAGYEWYNQML